MKTLKLKSAYDSLDLSVAVSEAEGEAKGIFQISHGMAEHKERYFPFMNYLSKQGWVCVIHDHRGHGESIKSPEDLGFMFKGGADALVEDLLLVQDWAKKEYPGLEICLFGHSMGSMVVRAFCRKYDDRIAKLIVCGCPSYNSACSAGMALAGIVSFFCGAHHRSKLLNAMSFGSFGKLFPGEGALGWLSANKSNVKEYKADPLCGFCFTANGFKNLFKIMKECYNPKGWQMAHSKMPVLFVSGGDDPCRISDKDFDKAVDFMRERGYGKVSSKLYPGLRHEILLEGKAEVWEDIAKFIN